MKPTFIGIGWLDRLFRRMGVILTLHRSNRFEIRAIVPPLRDETKAQLHQARAADTLRLAEIMGRETIFWKTWEHAVLAAAITKPMPAFSE
jgi:hypothetical protein